MVILLHDIGQSTIENPNPKSQTPQSLKQSFTKGYNATRNTKLSPKVNGHPRRNMQIPKPKTKIHNTQNQSQVTMQLGTPNLHQRNMQKPKLKPKYQNHKPTLKPKILQTQNNRKPNMSNASSKNSLALCKNNVQNQEFHKAWACC